LYEWRKVPGGPDRVRARLFASPMTRWEDSDL
jgi:hypothetical protein